MRSRRALDRDAAFGLSAHGGLYRRSATTSCAPSSRPYDLGEVVSCKGIAEGVENSNFLLRTERGNFILTLYEKRVAPADLPFFIALMEHLARSGVACPTPLRARDGDALRELCGRPAAIVTFLNGMWPRRIQPFHCAARRRRAGAAPSRRRALSR